MTIDGVKKELERSARLTGKDVFVEAYKIITEQEKKIDQLNLDLESEKYRVERLKKELADKDLLIEQLQKSYDASFERLKRQQVEIERLKEKSDEQSRKSGILGNETIVEFFDDAVSEPSADCKDIEKYEKQFRNRIISFNEKEVKQAQIDIINTQTDTINAIVKYCENPNHWLELKDCKLWGGKSDDLRFFLNGIFKEVDV